MNINDRITEKDIEDWLFDNPQHVSIYGNQISRWIGRQARVPSGIIDLVGVVDFEHSPLVVVVEIKNDNFKSSHITQVCRYAYDIRSAIEKIYFRNHLVWKVIIGTGSPTNKVLYEANSADVFLMSFIEKRESSVTGPWKWTEETEKRYNKKIHSVALCRPLFDYIDRYRDEEMRSFAHECMAIDYKNR